MALTKYTALTFQALFVPTMPAPPIPLPEKHPVQVSGIGNSPPNFIRDYDPSWPRGYVSHRGPYGKFGDDYLPDSSLQAQIRGIASAKFMEVDAVVDKNNLLVAAHDLDRFRQSPQAGQWDEIDFELLPEHSKEYVLRDIIDGKYSKDKFKRLGIYHMTTEEQIKYTLACEPGVNLIMDTRKNHAIYGVKLMVEKLGHVIGQVMVQVYNFGFEDANDFIRQVEALGLPDKWRDVNLIITPNPGHFAAMAGIADDSPDHDAMLHSQLDWLNSFLGSDLKVKAVNIVVRGGYKYYDPQTKTVTHPEFGLLTRPKDVTPYAIDWVGKQLLDYWNTCTTMPAFAPANSYAVKKDGNFYIDGFHKGELKLIDPNTPAGWLFLNGGRPDILYDAGVKYPIADNPELFDAYLNGVKTASDAHLDFPPHNYENFGFERTSEQL